VAGCAEAGDGQDGPRLVSALGSLAVFAQARLEAASTNPRPRTQRIHHECRNQHKPIKPIGASSTIGTTPVTRRSTTSWPRSSRANARASGRRAGAAFAARLGRGPAAPRTPKQNPTKPNQTAPNQTKPNQTKPSQAKPTQPQTNPKPNHSRTTAITKPPPGAEGRREAGAARAPPHRQRRRGRPAAAPLGALPPVLPGNRGQALGQRLPDEPVFRDVRARMCWGEGWGWEGREALGASPRLLTAYPETRGRAG
jgi:hypothetical protein